MENVKKILITGASGLVGSHLLSSLENENVEVYVISKSEKQYPASVKVIRLDLSSDWSQDLLPSKMDIIIHLAQSENFRLFPEKADDVFFVNTLSTLKLADYARKAGVSQFIYASSAGIYGTTDEKAFTEDEPIIYENKLGFYLGTKYCSEIILKNYEGFFNVIMLRFFFVYGEGQKRSMLMPRLVDSISEGKEIVLNGYDGLTINPINVKDAVAAIKKTFELKSSQIFNIGGDQILTLRKICEIIGSVVQRSPSFKVNETNEKNINIIGDISRMKDTLYCPKISVEEGIKDLL